MKNNISIKNLNHSLVFVGLMGAGKTTLGQAFAHSLGLDFIDSDDVIVEREGHSIPDIFKDSGESYFRALERQVIIELSQDKDIKIIGTGGGAFMNAETRQAIKKNMISIFLKADLDVLEKRIGSGEGRPLFEGRKVRDVLSGLMEMRYPIYEEADISVETKNEPLQETLNRVQQALYSHLSLG